jgi:nucleoside-diphosphate-sugar epimerase
MRIAVTGAYGFVGTELCRLLSSEQHDVRGIGRSDRPDGLNITDTAGLVNRFAGVDVVVHLAARAHVTHDQAGDTLQKFRAVNVEGTRCVAEAAVGARVRRLVFVSSIGVLGTATRGQCFNEASPAAPLEPYAVSKWEAEQVLRGVQNQCGLDVVILRPALVYGPYVKGNFLRLLKLAAMGLPLPFGSVHNARSFIGVSNLCDLISLCVSKPQAARELFVAADGEDLSTQVLMDLLASALGKRVRTFACPLPVLSMAMTVIGKREEFTRLVSDLCVDASRARSVLGWRPRKDCRTGIIEMAQWFARMQCT